jgi:hypothetical protein
MVKLLENVAFVLGVGALDEAAKLARDGVDTLGLASVG